MQYKIQLPFYLKLLAILVSILIIGYLSIIGQTVLVPMIVGGLLAILLTPITRFWEAKLKIPRSLSAVISVIVFISLILFVFYLLGTQVTAVAEDWPAFKQQLLDMFDLTQIWIEKTFKIKNSEQIQYINDALSNSLSTGTLILSATILSVSSFMFFTVFTILFTFFFLLYRKHLVTFLTYCFHSSHGKTVDDVVNQVQYVVKKYLIGLLLQMAIVAGLSIIVFSIIGIKYSILLGLITGIINILPYIGFIVALIFTVLITFATAGLSHVLAIIIALVIIHLIDSNYIMPKIVGSKVKINSMIALIGIVIGQMIWGISGMFLSIPIIAIFKIIFDRVPELTPWGYLLGEDDEKEQLFRKIILKRKKQTITTEITKEEAIIETTAIVHQDNQPNKEGTLINEN